MRTIREVLRLRWETGLSHREIGVSCRLGPTTVRDYLLRAEAAGLRWPLPEGMDDEALERLLFPPPAPSLVRRPQPDWPALHQELRRKGMTLGLRWHEYREVHPDGYGYSQFCARYQEWAKCLEPVLRQQYVAGEKLFVDYAGQTVPIVDRRTGEVREAQLFVAVLGASNYTYVEATWTQGLPDWIESHRRCFEFLGGVPALVVPDNLKAGVTSPCFYDPELNRTYQKLAEHFGTAVVPARIRRPRDKAKAETGVQGVERWLLARLRERRFFSLPELNAPLWELLAAYNRRPFQKLEGSRESLFLALDRPALKPLPSRPYEYAEWGKARVSIDYHVEVDRHYYSVPYQLLHAQVEVRLSARTVEILHKGKREWFSLTKKHTALGNEAQALLEVWFPELERLFQRRLCKSVRAVIGHYESPQALLAAGKGRLRGSLRSGTSGRCGRYTEPIWEAAQHSVALGEGQQSRVRALRGLVAQVALVERRQEQLVVELAQWLAQTPEAEYLRTVPRLGVIIAAGLLGECGPLGEFVRAAAVEKFVGLHLYRLSSGKRTGKLHLSKRGRSGARSLLGQLAALHLQRGGLGYAWAQAQRAQGKKGAQLETALARKLLRVLYALCRKKQRFDVTRWEAEAQTADGVPALQGASMVA